MPNFKIDSGDLPTLQVIASAMFVDKSTGLGLQIPGPGVYQGAVPGDPNPEASFVLWVVGGVSAPTGATVTDEFGNSQPVMAPVPGVYLSGLKINGLNPFTSGLMTIPAVLKVYSIDEPIDSSAFWSLDGVTPAPGYVAVEGNI